jgi:ubiquinone/menaquinone biosynthesis C-methylase UbiE
MIKVSRKLNWISSIHPNSAIDELAKAMQQFYSSDKSYFSEIDFTVNNWIDEQSHCYKKIVELAQNSNSICEVGCGKANILKHFPAFRSKYTGFDFSQSLMNANSDAYPGASFAAFQSPEVFPVENEKFDLVFCVFVLEHVTRPTVFLNECNRILKTGGRLVILCPHYLGRGRMTSQRSGYSSGNAKDKLKQFKILDALVTLFDNRVRIPYICKKYAGIADQSPLFLINCSPVMFTDKFQPDVDAVYITYKNEIVSYLNADFNLIGNSDAIQEIELNQKVIFLEMQKK